jgi:sec-independent protein translocase protein TatA
MFFTTQYTCALFGDIGGGELLVVLAAILLLFGGNRLPSMARQIGRMVEELRKASQNFKDQLMNADREIDEPSDTDEALNPAEPPKKDPTPRDFEG